VDQSASIALTIIVALAVMSLLATAAATLSAKKLARAVQLFTNLQAVAIVGVSGAKHSPFFDEELTAVFTYLNFSQSSIPPHA
jgi:CMP-N-acetylneuraminic acid synthetase